MATKLDIIKTAVNFAAGAGVSKVVHDIIQNNTDPEDLVDKTKVVVGSAVIGSMVADRASEHVNAKIDAAAVWMQNLKDKKTTDK